MRYGGVHATWAWAPFSSFSPAYGTPALPVSAPVRSATAQSLNEATEAAADTRSAAPKHISLPSRVAK